MYNLHQDAGHAWLEVPLKELRELNIENDITGYSYVKGDKVFLEEDHDMITFLDALKIAKPQLLLARNRIWDGDNSPIRNYEYYKST